MAAKHQVHLDIEGSPRCKTPAVDFLLSKNMEKVTCGKCKAFVSADSRKGRVGQKEDPEIYAGEPGKVGRPATVSPQRFEEAVEEAHNEHKSLQEEVRVVSRKTRAA